MGDRVGMDAKRLAYLRSLAVTARDNPATWDERDCPMVALIAALEPAMIVELIDGYATKSRDERVAEGEGAAVAADREPAPDADEIVSGPAFAYLCEWIFERPDDLPDPHNRPVGLRIVEHETTRSGRRASITDEPGMLSWSTAERVDDMRLVNWVLDCWATLAGLGTMGHCRKIEITRS